VLQDTLFPAQFVSASRRALSGCICYCRSVCQKTL